MMMMMMTMMIMMMVMVKQIHKMKTAYTKATRTLEMAKV
jgi:hypothetical protein